MTREHILMILGALVLLSPWSGIPMEWLQWVLLLIGIAIIGIAFTMRKRQSRDVTIQPTPDELRPRSSNIAFS
ncbi:MAG TPA: hypothetical protein VN086_02300 [Candidatus Paceibacterota bacterium]|nr:hypothetical protein [Candidatus Paceibacterota bacterium]